MTQFFIVRVSIITSYYFLYVCIVLYLWIIFWSALAGLGLHASCKYAETWSFKS